MEPERTHRICHARFRIEFDIRYAKQHLGLIRCRVHTEIRSYLLSTSDRMSRHRKNPLRLAGINAHVVEFHALRPYVGIDALGAGPVAPHGNGQNEMEGMIEGPVPLIRGSIPQPFVFECVVVGVIHMDLDG